MICKHYPHYQLLSIRKLFYAVSGNCPILAALPDCFARQNRHAGQPAPDVRQPSPNAAIMHLAGSMVPIEFFPNPSTGTATAPAPPRRVAFHGRQCASFPFVEIACKTAPETTPLSSDVEEKGPPDTFRPNVHDRRAAFCPPQAAMPPPSILLLSKSLRCKSGWFNCSPCMQKILVQSAPAHRSFSH